MVLGEVLGLSMNTYETSITVRCSSEGQLPLIDKFDLEELLESSNYLSPTGIDEALATLAPTRASGISKSRCSD